MQSTPPDFSRFALDTVASATYGAEQQLVGRFRCIVESKCDAQRRIVGASGTAVAQLVESTAPVQCHGRP